MTTHLFITKNRTMLTLLGVVAAAVVIGAIVVSERLESYQSTVQLQIADQTALLTAIAERTARNGADTITESIVQDCEIEQRVRFNDLLGRLDVGLTRSELQEVDQLFAACANIQAQRKAVMVSRLNREIEVLDSYVAQLNSLVAFDQSDTYQLDVWNKLAEHEAVQSKSLKELVVAQKAIIDTLLAGGSADSPEMLTILAGVRETQEALLLATTQATNVRASLTNL